MIFERDRARFEAEFPKLRIEKVRPFMPFRYLVSGGVSMWQLMPERAFGVWQTVESWACKWPRRWPMFAFIQVTPT